MVKTFESLDTDLPRFMSEFGFQSFPEMKTISTFAAPEDYQIESEVMNAHQKSSIGNARFVPTWSATISSPKNLKTLSMSD